MPNFEADPMLGLTHELQDVFASVPSLPASGVASLSFFSRVPSLPLGAVRLHE